MSEVLVGAISTTLLALIAQAVRWVNAYINAHFRPGQLAAVVELARTAVQAAQEYGVAQDFDGATKLQYAKSALQAGAKKVGIKLTDAELSSFLHAALREMKQVAALTMPAAA